MGERILETMGDRIRRRRKEQGKTLKELASDVGVSMAAVSLWERGDTSPTGDKINRLCKALDCTPIWLLEGLEHLTASSGSVANKYTKYELDKLSTIFDILPREYRLKVVEYAETLLEDYHSEVVAKIKDVKSMKFKE
ncbi:MULTISPECIES: helix-turn-helix domain-containing protein [Klebsiella]|uniref:helix-turn-helix domain-containing protein n=1 Tax=Klebsiella TaxID=570 RepID=UPI000A26C676|nr:helix-turn-helix domain-containing protein [Klebsiella pneumoniae]EKT9410262.1 helix-turn-helix domain-containing protein [Klebsiella pneumoniae]EKY0469269.1 helix-turn-helix domain-containing protein [Klebsiella pneumoniae]MBX4768172.1 helix-turn-helix domain-containing protein [Klebsiella pneumoniae]MBZ1706324.1 helix-turn-helix domain-containing protein [Klebsiella pneumoniae]MCK9807017.1 helix-turn-helix domain-containing protein [Klebsiella pneumoniae]